MHLSSAACSVAFIGDDAGHISEILSGFSGHLGDSEVVVGVAHPRPVVSDQIRIGVGDLPQLVKGVQELPSRFSHS